MPNVPKIEITTESTRRTEFTKLHTSSYFVCGNPFEQLKFSLPYGA